MRVIWKWACYSTQITADDTKVWVKKTLVRMFFILLLYFVSSSSFSCELWPSQRWNNVQNTAQLKVILFVVCYQGNSLILLTCQQLLLKFSLYGMVTPGQRQFCFKQEIKNGSWHWNTIKKRVFHFTSNTWRNFKSQNTFYTCHLP